MMKTKTKLGEWGEVESLWGYHDDHDAEGVLLRERGSGDEIGFYPSGELIDLLYRVGSMGFFCLIYRDGKWHDIPGLGREEIGRVYERWGC